MKAKIVVAVSALILGTITTANADLYIESPRGVTQTEWNNSDTYKNFSCPDGYGRAEGVDLNWTATRTDDFYYASCSVIILPQSTTALIPQTPQPTATPTPTATSETSTATVTSSATTPVNNATATVTTETATTVTDTTTTTIASNTVDSLMTQIMALLTQLMALIAKLNR